MIDKNQRKCHCSSKLQNVIFCKTTQQNLHIENDVKTKQITVI